MDSKQFEMTPQKLDMLSITMGGSFYLFNDKLFEENYLRFRNTLQEVYEKSQVAYALKANYMPEIIRILRKSGGMAEVVSRLEYDIARTCLDGRNIIFNGPAKSKKDIHKALREGASVNIDSWYQIEIIKKLSLELEKIDIGLRYNSSEVFSDCRFGFNYENGDLYRAIKELKSIENINIVSLHSHYSSSEKSPAFFRDRAKKSIEIHDQLKLTDLHTINLGGGFIGRLPSALCEQFGGMNYRFEDYAKATGQLFRETYGNEGPRLMVEPGISLVGETMKLIARVLEIKNMHGRHYAVLDTNINTLNPTRSRIKPSCSAVSHNLTEPRKYTLVGNTCMETDILVEEFNGALSVGDYVAFDNRGAYSNNFTPAFIMPQPGIVSIGGSIFKQPDDMNSILLTYTHHQ